MTAEPDIGIITALPIECSAVLHMLDQYESIPASSDDPNRYYIGMLATKLSPVVTYQVVLALCSKMGNNGAAMVAKDLIRSFHVKHIILVGIAAGVPCIDKADRHVRLGDVVVSAGMGVVQYDMTKRRQDGSFEIRSMLPPPSGVFLGAVRDLEVGRLAKNERPWEKALIRAREFASRPPESSDRLLMPTGTTVVRWKQVAHPVDPERTPGQPKIYSGLIGSGNCLLKDVRERDRLAAQLSILAIEMEGAGVADATWNQTEVADYLIIRGICDYADRFKNDDWQKYAAAAAAAYMRALLEVQPIPVVPRQNGAALRQVAVNDRSDAQGFEGKLATYLQWVRAINRSVTVRGLQRANGSAVTLPVSSMFVSLEAVAKARSGVSEEPYLNQKELSLIPLDFSALSPASDETTRDSKDQRATVLAEMALSISPTVIITGGPGSGKTTVLQYIAFVLAESLLSGDSSVATTKLGVVGEMPIPVAAPLNAYAKHLSTRAGSGDPRDSTLLRFLEEYLILRQANLGLPSEFFSRLLHEGRPCVFLLDGLDEIADEAERVQVSRAIQDLAQSPFRSSIITTSRTRAYRGDAVLPPEFEELKLRALGTTAVHGLIEAFCTAFYRDPDERLRNLRSLVQSIEALEQGRRFAKSTIGPLISSPLMVRMVITLHLSGRSIPDQRAELYQNYIDALILATYHPDVVVANRLSTAGGSLYTQRSLLARIAFEMHKRGEHERPALSERELTSVVYRHLALSVTSHEAQESTGRFLEATRQRGGVLEESAGMYQFNHPALEEFLTGRYLAETLRHPEKISAFLEEDRRIARSWWHEPAVLCIGYVSSTSPDTAHELLQYLIDFHQSDDVLALAQLEAVGEACVEWQVGSSVRDQLATKLTEILFGATTHGIPADLRVAAGRILGLLGDKRLDVDAKVPQVARIPEGKFSMGHGMDQERVNLPSFQSGAYGMEVKEFAIGLYPVTNYQFREFISAGGYTAASRDCWTKTGWDWRVVMDIGSPAYWEDPTWTIDNHPVVGVSWFEAIAYCRWLSQTTARRISLPTEVEWEKAAKGAEVRAWPWGAKFVPEQANTAEGGIGQTVCVGLFPGNESPFGVRDCAGNVWNWCSSQFRGFGQYDPSDGREELEGSSPRCIRGGSWLNAKDFARCANRDHYFPGDRHFDLGFRIKEILS